MDFFIAKAKPSLARPVKREALADPGSEIQGTLLPLGGWATFNNTDFASNNGTNVVAFAGFTALTTAGGGTQTTTIFSGGNVALTSPVTADAMKITTAGTITLGANNFTVNGTNGGILTTAAETIDTSGGGVLSAGAGNELILGGNATLTISGNNLIGANSGSLTKIDSNTIIISGANSYTGGTNITTGTVIVGNNSALGTGPITFTNGVLTSNAAVTLTNPTITAANTQGYINPGSGLTLSSAVTGSGALVMQAAGNVASVMSGDFSQFAGTLFVNTSNNDTNRNVGGSTAASNNLGQANVVLTGNLSNRRFTGWTGVLQVGAFSSAVGAGTWNVTAGNPLQVGALGTNSSFGGSAATINEALTKVGTGTLTLNSIVGVDENLVLNVNNGALVLDDSNMTTPTSHIGSGSALALGGGTFTLLEKAGTATSQGLGSTTVNAGYSNITANQNGGTAGVVLTLAGIM